MHAIRRTALLPALGLAAALILPLAGCAGQSGGPQVNASSEPASPGGPQPSGTPSSPAPLPGSTGSPAAPSGRATSPPLSSTVLPTLRPATKPPDEPTDRVRTDVVLGWISRGGSGPCYGMTAEDGTEYALYGHNAGTLAKGTHVLVRIAPLALRVDCGAGKLVSIVSIRPS